jgi:hypothetical protein
MLRSVLKLVSLTSPKRISTLNFDFYLQEHSPKLIRLMYEQNSSRAKKGMSLQSSFRMRRQMALTLCWYSAVSSTIGRGSSSTTERVMSSVVADTCVGFALITIPYAFYFCRLPASMKNFS